MPIKTASQLCIKTCDFRQSALIFVRRGVNYCNAVARAIVALLGRFLPRLGPLFVSGPFFYLFLRRPVWAQFFQWNLAQAPGQRLQIGRQLAERAGTRVAALVHVKRAVDLELDGVQAGGRVAVMLGYEAAGIGLIPAHGVAQAAQGLFNGLGHRTDATGAVAVAEYEFRPWPLVLMAGGGRHGMAIDQHGGAKVPL